MSMLTPPGLGGKYRIRGDRYPRMRRPRRRGRTLVASAAAVLAVAVLGWGTLQLVDIFTADAPARAAGHHAGKSDCASRQPDAARGVQGGAKKAGSRDEHGSAVDSRAHSARLPDPGSITVNVLNATSRSGLAGDTADALKQRGFTIGKVANAPAELDRKVDKPALLLGAPGSTGVARLKALGTQVKGEEIRYDERDGKDVDLVLGKEFTKLTAKKAATAALAGPAAPGTSPSPPSATCR